MKEIVLGGGCFWGMEKLFSDLKGVKLTQVGYMGGHLENPSYEQVCTGQTGHAEVVKLTYDENLVSLEEVLSFFFHIHDPTTFHRQGNDQGSQYRSAIFTSIPEEVALAKKVIEETQKTDLWKDKIVTSIEPLIHFYPAEGYHQKYLEKNPAGYCNHFIRK